MVRQCNCVNDLHECVVHINLQYSLHVIDKVEDKK